MSLLGSRGIGDEILEGALSFDVIVADMGRMESRKCDLIGDITS